MPKSSPSCYTVGTTVARAVGCLPVATARGPRTAHKGRTGQQTTPNSWRASGQWSNGRVGSMHGAGSIAEVVASRSPIHIVDKSSNSIPTTYHGYSILKWAISIVSPSRRGNAHTCSPSNCSYPGTNSRTNSTVVATEKMSSAGPAALAPPS